MEKARIILIGREIDKIQEVCDQIVDITKKVGSKYAGPVAIPTRKMKITTLKAPDGEGTASWDRWEMRIHKRIIDLDANERTLRQVMRVQVPDGVHIEIELTK